MQCAMSEIGSRIAALRNERGLSQDELSKKLNIGREVVAKWENGTRDLKTQYTVMLADFFGITCDEILRGVKSENIKINEKTGLFDASIEKLNQMNENDKISWQMFTLNNFIQCEKFNQFIATLKDYVMESAENEIELTNGGVDVAVNLHNNRAIKIKDIYYLQVQNTFKDIIDELQIKLGNSNELQLKWYFRIYYDTLAICYNDGKIDKKMYDKAIKALDNGDYVTARKYHREAVNDDNAILKTEKEVDGKQI